MESSVEYAATLFHTGCNLIGMFLNGLLLYLVITKTPTCIRTYSILILNFGVTDLCGCLSALFVQQRVIPVGSSLAYISSGPCRFFGARVCWMSYSFMLHCYAHSLWSLLLSFLYRYHVLSSKNISQHKLIAVLLLFYSISFFQFVLLCTYWDDPEVIITIIHRRFPQYQLDGHAVTGNKNIFEWKVLFAILHMTVPVTPVYCIIIYLRQRIVKMLGQHAMSAVTKVLHTQLLKALTFQAILPGLFLFGVVTYAIGQTGIYNHPLMEYMTIVFIGIIPTISPIGNLYMITPYRNWIAVVFTRREVETSKRTSAVNASSQ